MPPLFIDFRMTILVNDFIIIASTTFTYCEASLATDVDGHAFFIDIHDSSNISIFVAE